MLKLNWRANITRCDASHLSQIATTLVVPPGSRFINDGIILLALEAAAKLAGAGSRPAKHHLNRWKYLL